MATALHSRHLLTEDIRDQHADAESQLTALEQALELGLDIEAHIQGSCLDLYLSGDAGKVADLVKALDEEAVFIAQVTPEGDDERELLQKRIGHVTDVVRTYEHF